jgi:hypothetical protein
LTVALVVPVCCIWHRELATELLDATLALEGATELDGAIELEGATELGADELDTTELEERLSNVNVLQGASTAKLPLK